MKLLVFVARLLLIYDILEAIGFSDDPTSGDLEALVEGVAVDRLNSWLYASSLSSSSGSSLLLWKSEPIYQDSFHLEQLEIAVIIIAAL